MIKKMHAVWNLRELMEAHCFHSTSDLVPQLAERGIILSRIQVYRLATQTPSRVSMDILAALCDILSCTPNDLISITVVNQPRRKVAGEAAPLRETARPLRVRVRRPK